MNRVAVVIPTWNRGELLQRAMRSALNQGEVVSQVVVVDNGSQPAILGDLADERVKLIAAAPNIGASAARNLGVGAAGAEIIAFLDDDDYWKPGFISAALPLFDRGADIVVGRLMRRAEDGGLKEYKLLGGNVEAQRELYFRNPGFGGQNILVRRSLYKKLGGFDCDMPASEDRDFAVRALQAGAIIMVQPDSVAVLCDHEGERARHKQILGNYCFIKKHWKHMTWVERYRACKTLVRRYASLKLKGAAR